MTTYDDYGVPATAYSEPERLKHQAWRVARAFVVYRLKPRLRNATSGKWEWRRTFSLGRVLIVIWLFAVYWGERKLFKNSIDSCQWENWENWVCALDSHNSQRIPDYLIGWRRQPAQTCFNCRSSTHRSTFLSRPTMAAQPPHSQIYRCLPPSNVFTHTNVVVPRHRCISR
jgi:hypothetical protein